ncbi:MAG: hypothetical protein R6U11_03940 [Bacteroidales bacterium]
MRIKLSLFLLLNIYMSSLLFSAEPPSVFVALEDSLRTIKSEIPQAQYDFEKLSLNEKFKNLFCETLQKEGALDYPFDSLETVSILAAPDNSFRIITWYITLLEGEFEYYGIFQVRDDRKDDILIYHLKDTEHSPDELKYLQLSHEDWYGMYYYEIIHNRYKREDYYTLLGWRADNPLTRKRIIEPFRLGGNFRPVFGIPQFTYDDNKYKRVVFEYSAKVSMSLKYDKQYIQGSRRPKEMIVFDRLAPSHQRLKGHYQFYFPETNVFDAFIFEDGRWVFIEEIDARNPD